VGAADEVLQRAREARVRFVRLQFTDVLGVLKDVAIPVESLPEALAHGVLFDGSSIEGFVRVEESDMMLQPDPATFQIFPWSTADAPTARLLCDVTLPGGAAFPGCPRTALKRVLGEAAARDIAVRVEPEIEFFLFERDASGLPTTRTRDQAGYFDLSPVDEGEDVRRDVVLALEDMAFQVEASHHEVAPGQHEIDLAAADPLACADGIVTFRVVARTVARRRGYHITFMPKPVVGINGSGLHLRQTLTRAGRNLLEPAGGGDLAPIGSAYLAGILRHAKALSAVTNPLVNSYKRLVPGYEAPEFIAWSRQSRSPMIRVSGGGPDGLGLELRAPDPSCNPYLALAAIIRAGLDGVDQGWDPPPPVRRNVHRMTDSERQALGIDRLPASLREALDALEADPVVREALGEHLTHRLLEAKRIEWDVYRAEVHRWEVDQYLGVY
jgi:glutamine synthetase